MIKYITVVIKYEDEATFHAQQFNMGMTLLGGTVGAVMFDDALQELDDIKEKLEDLEEAKS